MPRKGDLGMPITKDHLTAALALIDCVSISASDAVFEDLADRLNVANDQQKKPYQNSWSRTATKFERARSTCDDLKSVLDDVSGIPSSNGIITSDVGSNEIRINMASYYPTKGHMVVVRNGEYEMVPNGTTDARLIDAILDAITSETQAVIEMGCGWGRNLAGTALRTNRRDLTFIGLEPSADGLKCTKELLATDPTIQAKTSHFDFYSPDFSMLKEYDNIVVFSCAAIEQIAFIGAEFIDQVMAICDNVTLILYEPIGWQRSQQLQKFGVITTVMEIMGNVPPDKQQMKVYAFELMDSAVSSNAVSWSIGARYNLNLWSVIQDAISREIVHATRSEFDIFGINPFNPYSLIVLEKRDPVS